MCRGSVRGSNEWSRAARAVGSEVVLRLVLEEDATRRLRVPRKQLELGPQTLFQRFVACCVFFAGPLRPAGATNFPLVSQLELRLDPEASSRKFRGVRSIARLLITTPNRHLHLHPPHHLSHLHRHRHHQLSIPFSPLPTSPSPPATMVHPPPQPLPPPLSAALLTCISPCSRTSSPSHPSSTAFWCSA